MQVTRASTRAAVEKEVVMTTQQPDPGGRSRPDAVGAQPEVTRRSYPTSGHPRSRAVIWGAALLAGGFSLILIFFWAIGVIDLYEHAFLGVLALAFAVFFGVTIWSYSRSERRGNSRWADRERRGF